MNLCKISLAEKFALFNDEWNQRIVGEFDNYLVKISRISGEFVWHHHENEDELFVVVEGRIDMHYRDETGAERVEQFGPNEILIVPHGIEHKPVAAAGTKVMLIEHKGVVNTGDVRNDRTREPARI